MTRRRQYPNRFRKNEDGDVAILFGVMVVILVVMIGSAVDFSRWLHARNHTIAAMDFAVLAGGRSLQVNPADKASAVSTARAFYIQNNQSRLAVVNDTIGFAIGDDGQSIVSTGNAYVATLFLGLIDIHVLPILNEAGDEHPKSEFGVGGRRKQDVEVALVLDVTNSMDGERLDDLKSAAKDLVNIIVEDNQNYSKSRVAIIPTSEGVRLPPDAHSLATGGARADSLNITESHWHPYFGQTTVNRTYNLTVCVAERIGSEAFTDAAPGPGNHVLSIYSQHLSRDCSPDAANEMLPLSDDKTALKTAIDDLVPGGQAAMHVGIAWSWYAISPNWNRIWPSSENHAASYGAANTQKVAVLMTDGAFNTQYSVEGIAVDSHEAALGSSVGQISSLCAAMKQAGVVIFTIGFALQHEVAAEAAMAQCASDTSKVFTAEDGDDLIQAFRAVALEISKVYLAS